MRFSLSGSRLKVFAALLTAALNTLHVDDGAEHEDRYVGGADDKRLHKSKSCSTCNGHTAAYRKSIQQYCDFFMCMSSRMLSCRAKASGYFDAGRPSMFH